MDIVLAICAGIALSAACGLRVFLPLFAASLAAHLGYLHPSGGMSWLGSPLALTVFGVATVLEVAAYYIPWLDHALDTIATPAAVVAGAVVAAAAFGDLHPAVKWTSALIAGGGVAGTVQGTTVLARATSTLTTGGLANPVVASVESTGALVLAALAIFLPVLAVGVLLLFALALFVWYRRRKARQVCPVVSASTLPAAD